MSDNTNGYITFNVTLNILMAVSARYFIPDIFDINNVQNQLSYCYIASTLCLVICYAIIQTHTYKNNKKPNVEGFDQIILWNIVFTGLLIFLLKFSTLFKAYTSPIPQHILNLFVIVYYLILILGILNTVFPFICCFSCLSNFIEGKFGVNLSKNPIMSLGTIVFLIIGVWLLLDNLIIFLLVTLISAVISFSIL